MGSSWLKQLYFLGKRLNIISYSDHPLKRFTLRAKTSLIMVATTLTLLIIVYIPVRIHFLQIFADVEVQRSQTNVQRALNAISDLLDSLNRITADWSAWDDSYLFIQGLDPSFVESNLESDRTFINLGLNFVLFFDASGKIVFERVLDPTTNAGIPIPTGFRAHIRPGSSLLSHPTPQSSQSGIILIPEPVLVVSRPIVTNEEKGPIRGTLIFGRFLSIAVLHQISEKVRLPIDIYAVNDPKAPLDIQQIRSRLTATTTLAQPLGIKTTVGYALIQDVYDHPALVMRITTPRDIYLHGSKIILYIGIALIIAGVLFGLVTMILLDRIVLMRIAHLGRDISYIYKNGIFSARVTIRGNDEVSDLATITNTMLETIEYRNIELAKAMEVAQNARLAAEEANRTKSQFLASMSHELRTPLNAIIGYSEMLKEEAEDFEYEDITTDLSKIQTAAQHLLSLINDILDISKIEAGKIEIYLETFELSSLINNIVTTIQPIVDKNDNRLIIQYDQIITTMYSDQTKVRQILLNLLSNACKFTQNGTVTLTIQHKVAQIEWQKTLNNNSSLLPSTSHDNISISTSNHLLFVVFRVSDTGIGMSPEQLKRLFKAFSQADASTTRNYGGTGLGLVISQRFCQMMGGDIQVESVSGQGTTFIVYLPVYTQKDIHKPKIELECSIPSINSASSN